MKELLKLKEELASKYVKSLNDKELKAKYSKALYEVDKALLFHSISNDWSEVQDKIYASKIKRFDYKTLLGESLTSFITKRKHLNDREILNDVLRSEGVIKLINFNPYVRGKLIENVKTSISSRKAEQSALLNRL